MAWGMAVRVAGVASLLAAAAAFGLARFLGVGAEVIVVLTAVVGLGVGARVPVPVRASAAPAPVAGGWGSQPAPG